MSFLRVNIVLTRESFAVCLLRLVIFTYCNYFILLYICFTFYTFRLRTQKFKQYMIHLYKTISSWFILGDAKDCFCPNTVDLGFEQI